MSEQDNNRLYETQGEIPQDSQTHAEPSEIAQTEAPVYAALSYPPSVQQNTPPYTSSYTGNAYTPYAQPPIPTGAPKRRKKRGGAALIACCFIGSAAFGFGGSYLAGQLPGNQTNSGTDKTAVVYQSVIKAPTDENTEKLTIADVAATAKASVVEITTEVVSRNRFLGQLISTGAGSGVIITQDGYIATNNHVIEQANTITVRLSDGTQAPATLVGTDEQTDLAVIKINKTELQPAVLGHSAELVVGETAVAIGNPLGELGGTVTEGIISALDREITMNGQTMSLLQTSAAINPGNSGGGLFNLGGELIGVVNAKSSGSDIEGLGFAIPIDTAKVVITEIIENGYVTGRVDAGFTLLDIQDAQTAMSYRVSKLGLYIYKSGSGSFLSGDIIKAIDEKSVENLEDYNTIMGGYQVGDTVQITVERSGSTQTLPLTLGEQKN